MQFSGLLCLLVVAVVAVSGLQPTRRVPVATTIFVAPAAVVGRTEKMNTGGGANPKADEPLAPHSCVVEAFTVATQLLTRGPVVVALYPGVHEVATTIDLGSRLGAEDNGHALTVRRLRQRISVRWLTPKPSCPAAAR